MGANRKWYQFGAFRFDGRLLYAGDERLELPEREAQVLLLLVENALHLVKKQDLLALYGARADVNNVDQAVARLRKVLGDKNEGKQRVHTFIDTVQGDGYVFKQPVRISHEVCAESMATYYRGLEWWGSREPEAMWKAKECFEAVLERDPTFARAYAALGDCYATVGSHAWMPADTSAARAKAAANKALLYDASLAEAHATLGIVYGLFEYRWRDGESQLLRALELSPDYATAHHRYALLQAATGRLAPALESNLRAKALDPLSRTIEVHHATILYWSRRYEEAERQIRETLTFNRHFWYAHYQLAVICEQLGRPGEAVREHGHALECFGEPSVLITAALARAHALAGSRTEARRLLEIVGQPGSPRGTVYFHTAAANVALEDPDVALRCLEEAIARSETWVSFIGVDPRLDPLRTDPRFPELLTRLGLPFEEPRPRPDPDPRRR